MTDIKVLVTYIDHFENNKPVLKLIPDTDHNMSAKIDIILMNANNTLIPAIQQAYEAGQIALPVGISFGQE